MTPTAIRLHKACFDAETAKRLYQSKCEHRKAVRVPRGNSGNYDPSWDRYWYDCSCPSCGKVWTENQ